MRLRATRLTTVAHAARIAVGGSTAWSPNTAWFAASEPGLWYDPSDLTRYMAPGPELLTNGSFATDIAGWTGVTNWTNGSWSAGSASVTTNGSFQGLAQAFSGLTIGATYRLRFSILSGSAANGRVYVGPASNPSASPILNQSALTAGSYLFTFVAAATSHAIGLSSSSASTGPILYDDISIAEVPLIATATMYQPSDGSLALTNVEQGAGLVLDRRLGATLGAELVADGGFDNPSEWIINAGWAVSGGLCTASAAAGGVPVLTTASQIIAGRSYRITYTITSFTAGGVSPCVNGAGFGTVRQAAGTFTEIATAPSSGNFGFVRRIGDFTGAIDNISVREIPGNHASQATSTARPTLRNRYNLLLATATLATQNVTTVATGYQLRFSGAGSITLSGTATGTYNAGTHSITCTAGTLTLTVSGSVTAADLLFATDAALPYQWVVTATNYDSDPSKFALASDYGPDDFVTTATGGGGTTGITLVAGVRLNTLGAARTIWSDAGTNTGYRLRINASNQVVFEAGNGSAYTSATVATALTLGQRAVISAWHDGATLSVQVGNGTIATAAMGTVTAGTASITIGRANGSASEYLNAYLYDIVYVQNQAKTADIAAAKSWLAGKMGVTL